MPKREIVYVGEQLGPSRPDEALVAWRERLDAAGSSAVVASKVEPWGDGPGQSEILSPPDPARDALLLFLHGSGFSKGSPRSHRPLIDKIVQATGVAAFVPDYRLAPEHPYPAALDDVLEVYRHLIRMHADARIIVIGDSAGGGLSLAMLLAARDEGLPFPAGVVTLSAWTDLAVSGDPRPDVDDPRVTQQMLRSAAGLYLDGADPIHPYASPLYGDFTAFPPILMQVGGREIMIEDSDRLVARARAQGVAAQLSVYPGMAHVFQLNQPETRQTADALAEIAEFVRGNLNLLPPATGTPSGGSR